MATRSYSQRVDAAASALTAAYAAYDATRPAAQDLRDACAEAKRELMAAMAAEADIEEERLSGTHLTFRQRRNQAEATVRARVLATRLVPEALVPYTLIRS